MRRPSGDLLGAVVLGFSTACAGASPEPEAPPAVPVVAPPAAVPSAEKREPPPPPDVQNDPAVAPAEPPPTSSDEQRNIRYVQTPEGLRVEVLGVKFVPKAEAVRSPSGIGLKLTLEATAGESRSLLSPKHGPLAFAGVIKRKGKSEPEPFGDERKGEGELLLDSQKPTKIVREWPGPKGGALGNGDVLELDVGLWGLGTSAEDRRPIKQFLRVKVVVENWKGRARVEPPPSMKGQG
jgi:hypothetical protein